MKIPFERMYEKDLIHPQEQTAKYDFQNNEIYHLLTSDTAEFINKMSERPESMLYLFPVTPRTAPRLNSLYESALKRLNCNTRYPLFLRQNFEIKATVSGSDEDFMIILSGIDALNDSEILALIGQALGRIKAEQWQTMLLLKTLESSSNMIPFFGQLAGKKMYGAFSKWLTAAQFTTDRAALFACGSEQTVASLILKQHGLSTFDLSKVLNQPVRRPEQLGIYFVFLMQSTSAFGGIERIQEMRNWIRSEEFKQNYPAFYYRLLLEDKNLEVDDEIITKHRNAATGNVTAMTELAEMYMRGEVLPKSRLMAFTLYKEAALCGDARAMYILALFLEQEKIDFTDKIHRLYSAACSHGLKAARKKILRLPLENQAALVQKFCTDFKQRYSGKTSCKVYTDEETVAPKDARDAFWIDADDKIYALEIFFDEENHIFGAAITAGGIFGRTSENELPFVLTWEKLRRNSVQHRRNTNEFISGNTVIYRAEGSLKGTIAEIITRIVNAL